MVGELFLFLFFKITLCRGINMTNVLLSLSLSHWYPGSGVVLDCIDS